MAVREYVTTVSMGLLSNPMDLLKISKKTIFSSLVMLTHPLSSAINKVPYNTFYDMPHLFQELLTCKLKVSSHLIEGYWLDIGRRSDYDKANRDFILVSIPRVSFFLRETSTCNCWIEVLLDDISNLLTLSPKCRIILVQRKVFLGSWKALIQLSIPFMTTTFSPDFAVIANPAPFIYNLLWPCRIWMSSFY